MKLLIFLNHDIHAATALNLLFEDLKKHQVRIILSKKVGKNEDLPKEILELKRFEKDQMEALFSELKADNINNKKFKTFDEIANFFGEEVLFYDDVNSIEALKDFKKFSPDLVLSIRYGKIFAEEFIGLARFGVLNLHSGLLPKYRGIMASFWAILNKEKNLNTTLHYITDKQIDRGKIIAFSSLEIDFDVSLFVNINRLYKGGCELVKKVISDIEEGKKILTIAENFGESKYFSYPKNDDVAQFLKIMPLVKDKDFEKIMGNC